MRARLSFIADELRNGYWFVPALMTFSAVLLSILTLWIDSWLTGQDQADLLQVVLYSGGADGAREVLSVIAGSMITVAGVVFSITIVALTLASNQFGPRLLSTFMSDRGNQVTLGTFISAFLYSLLVLRKTRTGDTEQVPHLSVAVALLLAVAGISVLIFFIHHVAAKIQAPNLIASIGDDLLRSTDRLFPHADQLRHSRSATQVAPLPDGFDGQAREVPVTQSGYVGMVDLDRLVSLATEHDLLVRLETRPGRFVVPRTALASVWPPDRVDEDVISRIAGSVVIGSRRTPMQDFEYRIEQLAQIAVRALSPGINDPYTATSCVDQLAAVLCELADRPFPERHLVDDSGDPRVVVAEPLVFAELVRKSYDAIRQCADFHTMVHVALLRRLTDVVAAAHDTERFEPVLTQAGLVLEAAEQGVKQEADLASVKEAYAALRDVAALRGAGATRG